ncbi:hypothetical protein CBR_g26107 [Chara braunii]|uniref:Endonuclease/exonuclease/phosphatase domain-containing protein n=1 Tax=Chara braunii TaxID=69332 RepID=A0A388JVU2_CHABU|nr:hypothetical protein CBR_g26107 [Chara braunii]|eukprot:GBG61944.1 hypothetical protein CBR_g26107 [Chara braunii]
MAETSRGLMVACAGCGAGVYFGRRRVLPRRDRRIVHSDHLYRARGAQISATIRFDRLNMRGARRDASEAGGRQIGGESLSSSSLSSSWQSSSPSFAPSTSRMAEKWASRSVMAVARQSRTLPGFDGVGHRWERTTSAKGRKSFYIAAAARLSSPHRVSPHGMEQGSPHRDVARCKRESGFTFAREGDAICTSGCRGFLFRDGGSWRGEGGQNSRWGFTVWQHEQGRKCSLWTLDDESASPGERRVRAASFGRGLRRSGRLAPRMTGAFCQSKDANEDDKRSRDSFSAGGQIGDSGVGGDADSTTTGERGSGLINGGLDLDGGGRSGDEGTMGTGAGAAGSCSPSKEELGESPSFLGWRASASSEVSPSELKEKGEKTSADESRHVAPGTSSSDQTQEEEVPAPSPPAAGGRGTRQWKSWFSNWWINPRELGGLVLQISVLLVLMRVLRPGLGLPGSGERRGEVHVVTTYQSVPFSEFLRRVHANDVQSVDVDGVHLTFCLRPAAMAASGGVGGLASGPTAVEQQQKRNKAEERGGEVVGGSARTVAEGEEAKEKGAMVVRGKALAKQVSHVRRIVYSTTRPNDMATPYQRMIENGVEFGAPDKRGYKHIASLSIGLLYIGLIASIVGRFPLKFPQRSTGKLRNRRGGSSGSGSGGPGGPIMFADVAGVDEAKEELEEIVEFLRNPERYARLGARPPRGVLLVGVSNCAVGGGQMGIATLYYPSEVGDWRRMWSSLLSLVPDVQQLIMFGDFNMVLTPGLVSLSGRQVTPDSDALQLGMAELGCRDVYRSMFAHTPGYAYVGPRAEGRSRLDTIWATEELQQACERIQIEEIVLSDHLMVQAAFTVGKLELGKVSVWVLHNQEFAWLIWQHWDQLV